MVHNDHNVILNLCILVHTKTTVLLGKYLFTVTINVTME